MYSEGYKYWLAYKKNKTSYYRCCMYKTKCPGRCVVEDGKIRNTTAHTHEPEPDRVLVEKFRKVLTHRAATESTDFYTIYWDEASQRHSDAAMLYLFVNAESAMRKARRKQLPPVPNTIQELGEVLTTSSLFRVHSGQSKDQFYQTTLNLDSSKCLIFVHVKTLEKIGRVEEMHIDASIEVVPKLPPKYYLLTIHSVQSYFTIPIIYVVMTEKSHSAYAAIFAYLREYLSKYIAPNLIFTNIDSDMQIALVLTFPEATIKGYWFHYTDDILKYMKHLGLQQEILRGHGASCLRMLLVLPLLPADYIAPGLQAVRKWAQEKKILSQQMITLCTYIEQNWIRSVGAEKISIFGLPHNIGNNVQNFNKELQTALGTISPTIWHMLENLTFIATRTFVKVNKRLKQPSSDTQPKKSLQVRSTILNDATQLWIRTPVHLRSPLNFLQLTSHCINDTLYYASLEDLKASKSDTNQESTKLVAKSLGNSTAISISRNILNSPNNKCVIMNGQTFNLIPTNQQQTVATIQNSFNNRLTGQVMQQPHYIISEMVSSDPPPLAFFANVTHQKRPLISNNEPPPLVPIKRCK